MRVLPFKIPKAAESAFHIQVDDEPYFYDTLHQHPEFQLTLIEQSTGSFIHGDYLGSFAPGDVFVIGANVPHVFRCDERYYAQEQPGSARALTLFFDQRTFGTPFLELPEARALTEFMTIAQRGLKVNPWLAEQIAFMIRQLFEVQGMEKLILLLQILNRLASGEDYELLTSAGPVKGLKESEGKRLNDIFHFTMKEYTRPIKLEEVAAIAFMSPSAFCRYFKQHTRKTYLDFLNEYRIGQACRLLMETDMAVSEVCYESGFNNLSKFNRKFKAVTGVTPKAYAKSF